MIHSFFHILFYLCYILLQCTWGLPQTLAGFLLFLIHHKAPHTFYKGAVCTHWKRRDGISLGFFIFVPEDYPGAESTSSCSRLTAHEYGHTIQSLLLGPFYLLFVGLPSFLWCNLPYFQKKRNIHHLSYYDFFPEKWADSLGKADSSHE